MYSPGALRYSTGNFLKNREHLTWKKSSGFIVGNSAPTQICVNRSSTGTQINIQCLVAKLFVLAKTWVGAERDTRHWSWAVTLVLTTTIVTRKSVAKNTHSKA